MSDHKVEFECDAVKEAKNIEKHGYSFQDAIECFYDENAITLRDTKHSKDEPRFYRVGKNLSGTVVTVRYTRRGSKIRIFGCAEWRKFKRIYEDGRA